MDKELSVLVRELYFIVLDKLCIEHFLTALEIAQSGLPQCNIIASVSITLSSLSPSLPPSLPLPCLPPADPKSSPTGLFCLVVGGVNSSMHLIEKLYRDTVVPCIRSATLVVYVCIQPSTGIMGPYF